MQILNSSNAKYIMYHSWKSTGVIMSPADKVEEWKSILGASLTIFAL